MHLSINAELCEVGSEDLSVEVLLKLTTFYPFLVKYYPFFGEYLEMVISHLQVDVQPSNLVSILASHKNCACKIFAWVRNKIFATSNVLSNL